MIFFVILSFLCTVLLALTIFDFSDAVLLVTIGELTSVMVGFVVFSILGYMAHVSGLPIAEVVKSGKLCTFARRIFSCSPN